jgi:penicillin-binding protein 2
MEEVRTGMVEVVNGSNGTGHEAQLDGVEVAGKTGTAQWGPKNKERTAAWFAGFLPSDEPKYAFAAVYEGDVGSKVHGGTTAAPMIADIFQEIYKGSATNKHGTRESTQQVRRAQPVEEDASD